MGPKANTGNHSIGGTHEQHIHNTNRFGDPGAEGQRITVVGVAFR